MGTTTHTERMAQARSIAAAFIALVLAVALAISMIPLSAVAQAESYEDGLYEVEGTVLQATGASSSMADTAFVRPLNIVAKNGELQLRATLQPVKAGALTGYLGTIGYYPGYEGGKPSASIQPTAAKVLKTYDATDDFNSLTGASSDSVVAGKKYPKLVALAVDPDNEYLWLRIYTPLMEGISKGSGTQYVRLKLDYATMRRIGDAPTDEEEQQEEQAAAKDRVPAYFSKLAKRIVKANKYLAKTKKYTKASLKKLRKACNSAVKTYNAKKASAAQVGKQVAAIDNAIGRLVKKKAQKKTSSKTSSASASKSTKSKKSTKTAKTTTNSKNTNLEMGSLADGTYTVSGQMLKTDKSTASMADKGIDHNIKIRVSGGAYYVRLSLDSVEVNGQASYLSKLRYYKQGYKGAAGGITGSASDATVLAYQKSGGKKTKDAYGTNYPAQVEFPLIAQAKQDGYVPLSVFVPIMEAIAKGNGTQDVYLALDLDSITTKATATATKPKKAASSTSSVTVSGSGASNPASPGVSSVQRGTSLGASTLGSLDDEPEAEAVDAGTEGDNTTFEASPSGETNGWVNDGAGFEKAVVQDDAAPTSSQDGSLARATAGLPCTPGAALGAFDALAAAALIALVSMGVALARSRKKGAGK